MRTKSSFWAALRRDKSPPPEAPVLEQIRSAMLAALAKHCGSMLPQMEMELALAISIEALWQKRPRLLQAIASYAGQAVAVRELQSITDLFVGHHPDAAR